MRKPLQNDTLTRVVALRLDNNKVQLRVGKDHVVLPAALDRLVLWLSDHRPVGMAAHTSADDPWLFPGRRPCEPISAAQLGLRLRRVGIESHADRSTALLQLARSYPASSSTSSASTSPSPNAGAKPLAPHGPATPAPPPTASVTEEQVLPATGRADDERNERTLSVGWNGHC